MHEGKKGLQNSQNLSNWEASSEDNNRTTEGRVKWLRQSLDIRVNSFSFVNKIQRGDKWKEASRNRNWTKQREG